MDCQENWSKEIWDVYEFTINFSKDSEKIEFSRNDLFFKVNNLKELAVTLSNTILETISINKVDSQEVVKTHSDLVIPEESKNEENKNIEETKNFEKNENFENTKNDESLIIKSETVQPTEEPYIPIKIPEVKSGSCLEGCSLL